MPGYRRTAVGLCLVVALTLVGALSLSRVTARDEVTRVLVPLVARDYVPPRLWTGTTDAGQPLSFIVSPDGSEWSQFEISIKYFAPGCNARGVVLMSAEGPGVITEGQFSYGDTRLSFSGVMDGDRAAHGTYGLRGTDVVISLPSPPYVCYATVSAEGTWVAGR